VCELHPANCPETPLTQADLITLELSWSRLGRALCQAFGCHVKLIDTLIPNTMQIGSWSADAVPVILTIQAHRQVFRRAIPELVARLRQPFILFAPTSRFLEANSQELLANVSAGFFPLDSNVILTDHGTLHPKTTPGELFVKFTPQPKEMDEDLASRVIALVSEFDSKTLTVFRLYCIEAMSAAQIARKPGFSRATVYRRLETIRAKTGMAPRKLRRLSPHLAKLEDQIADSRASHIHRKRLIYDDQHFDDSEP